MKLHLGCGQIYLQGYVNIDYPPARHSIQDKKVADKYADITKLAYPKDSIKEIRLHHVFEHFSRPIACALLVSWHHWLKPDGKLIIEVPDFEKTAWVALNPLSTEPKKTIALRHLFGSHEANWAVHWEGWTKKRLSKLMTNIGYKIIKQESNSWRYTHNFTLTAQKIKPSLTHPAYDKVINHFLSQFMIDNSPSEQNLHQIWLKLYHSQLKKGTTK